MGLEVRELDQLVHVLAIATVMLALAAIGLYGADLDRSGRQAALSAPSSERRTVPPTREELFRGMVRDLR